MYHVLAYGTLRVGEYNYKVFKPGIEVIQERVSIPGFRMFNLGLYPTVIRADNEDIIIVDLLKMDDDTFNRIHRMECGAGYHAMEMPLNLNGKNVRGYIYTMEYSKIKGADEIESGDWLARNDKAKRKIFVVGGSYGYISWMEGVRENNIKNADLVLFTGGEDVDPSLYKEQEHYTTGSNINRDIEEQKLFEEAVKLGKPIIGICRGSQFLCVMNGGKLVQHMNHPGSHEILTSDGHKLEATSTHHQMQYPFNLPKENYSILGWKEKQSPFHLGGDNEEMKPEKDCEIVYYPNTKSLAIQMHPEFFKNDHPTVKYLRNLLDNVYGEGGSSSKVSESTQEELQLKEL